MMCDENIISKNMLHWRGRCCMQKELCGYRYSPSPPPSFKASWVIIKGLILLYGELRNVLTQIENSWTYRQLQILSLYAHIYFIGNEFYSFSHCVHYSVCWISMTYHNILFHYYIQSTNIADCKVSKYVNQYL